MPIKQVNENTNTVTLVTTAETVLITTSPYYYDFPNPFQGGEHQGAGQGVTISGVVNFNTVGTAATNITLRVRQGGLSGPIVPVSGGNNGVITEGVAATANGPSIPYEAVDTTRFCAQSGGGIYVVTAQVASASANSTVQPVTCDVMGA